MSDNLNQQPMFGDEPVNPDPDDYADILGGPRGTYDNVRFEYHGDHPTWKNDDQQRRWYALRNRLCAAQNWACYYCRADLHDIPIHIDHKTPVSRGGNHRIENLCVACSTCNLQKGTQTDYEFMGIPAPVETPEPGHLQSGRRVRHPKFGVGVVIASVIRDEEEEVDVQFEGERHYRRLSVKFAKLDLI